MWVCQYSSFAIFGALSPEIREKNVGEVRYRFLAPYVDSARLRARSTTRAYTASSLSLRESGEHLISLDQCIAAMKRTGLDMSNKYKETSLGGLAVSFIEC